MHATPDGESATHTAAHASVKGSARLFSALLLLSTLALSILVVMLLRQNRQLRTEVEAIRQSAGRESLPSGEMLAALESFGPPASAPMPSPGLPGAPPPNAPPPDALAFADGRPGTVLFLFSGACGACDQALPLFASLAARHGPSGLECIAVQIDASGPDALAHTDMGVTVRGIPGAERTWLRRVPLVPAILIIDHDGVLIRAWFGAPDEPQWAEIEHEVAKLSGAPGQS